MDGRPNWISSWMADEDMARPRRTPHTNGGVDEEQGESSGDKAGGGVVQRLAWHIGSQTTVTWLHVCWYMFMHTE